MLFITILMIVICLYQAEIVQHSNKQFIEAFEKARTNSIKGFFILLVFISHFNGYVKYTAQLDIIWLRFFSLIGQRMVTLFLLYSGYGVMENIKGKGYAYIKQIPVKRIMKVLIRFDCAVLIFVLFDYIMGTLETYSITKVLLSFIGWESIGNSNWYIFAILSAYMITYSAFSILFYIKKNNNSGGLVLIWGGLILYIIILYGFTIKDSYWYDTILCYPLGMTFSQYKEKIGVLLSNKYRYIICFIGMLGVQVLSLKYNHILLKMTAMMGFAVLVVMITMKIKIQNSVLDFFGRHLFGIFILQRLPMMAFQALGESNVYLYFALCFVATVMLAVSFDRVFYKRKI